MNHATTAAGSVRSLLLACLVLTLAACASTAPRHGMYWGNYETSLYRLADAPDDRVQQQHLSNLRQVVNVSDSRGWPPPPGAMLELAMLELQMGNYDAYALLVNREYHLYPESRMYIQRWFTDVMVTPVVTEESEPADESTEAVDQAEQSNGESQP
ncbi:MAG: DUF4810 domain-containing protein [Idiomarina sp.]|nr:DUF4810 domain-containing protein [Idiomarina sp.]